MGLLKWLQKRGVAGLIPRNAHKQYEKWRRANPSLSEAEIAQSIFSLRYIIGNPILNQEETHRLICYLETNFECESLMGFCLASLDIEGHIDPSDSKIFYDTIKVIEEELERLGFPVPLDDISDFIDKWKQHILPLRRF